MKKALIITMCLLLIIGCGGGSDDVLVPPPPGPPPTADQIAGQLAVGSGIIGPNRLVVWSGDSSRLLVATGRGESFGQSFLHLLSTADLLELAPRLPVGSNVSDLAWVGSLVLVAARSSKELILIDPDDWRVVDTLPIDFSPISIAALSASTAVVSSTESDNSIIMVDVSDTAISIRTTSHLSGFARDLSYDPDRNMIYAIGPTLGIASINVQNLSVELTTPIEGTLSFGSTIWNGYLIAADRDGYVHLWRPGTREVKTVDLAAALGLERSQIALRGIDPIDVIPLGPVHLAVMNQRQNSLIFQFDATESIPLVPVSEFSRASFGLYDSLSNEILWAESATDRIRRAKLPSDFASGVVSVTDHVIGKRIVDGVPLTGVSDGYLAMLDSDNHLLVLDGRSQIVSDLSVSGVTWQAPLGAGPGGSVLVISSANGGEKNLWQLDISGAALDVYPLEISPVFSVSATETRILVTGRLTGEIQIIDVDSSNSVSFKLNHSRPRRGVVLNSGRALIFHDTHPDIGVTLLSDSTEERFVELELDRWWSDAYAHDGDAIASTFAGSIAKFKDDAQLSDNVQINFPGVKHIAPGAEEIIWIVSEELSGALAVSLQPASINQRIDIPELIRIYEFEPGGIWAVTLREVISLQL
jgi:hypothetical protein